MNSSMDPQSVALAHCACENIHAAKKKVTHGPWQDKVSESWAGRGSRELNYLSRKLEPDYRATCASDKNNRKSLTMDPQSSSLLYVGCYSSAAEEEKALATTSQTIEEEKTTTSPSANTNNSRDKDDLPAQPNKKKSPEQISSSVDNDDDEEDINPEILQMANRLENLLDRPAESLIEKKPAGYQSPIASSRAQAKEDVAHDESEEEDDSGNEELAQALSAGDTSVLSEKQKTNASDSSSSSPSDDDVYQKQPQPHTITASEAASSEKENSIVSPKVVSKKISKPKTGLAVRNDNGSSTSDAATQIAENEQQADIGKGYSKEPKRAAASVKLSYYLPAHPTERAPQKEEEEKKDDDLAGNFLTKGMETWDGEDMEKMERLAETDMSFLQKKLTEPELQAPLDSSSTPDKKQYLPSVDPVHPTGANPDPIAPAPVEEETESDVFKEGDKALGGLVALESKEAGPEESFPSSKLTETTPELQEDSLNISSEESVGPTTTVPNPTVAVKDNSKMIPSAESEVSMAHRQPVSTPLTSFETIVPVSVTEKSGPDERKGSRIIEREVPTVNPKSKEDRLRFEALRKAELEASAKRLEDAKRRRFAQLEQQKHQAKQTKPVPQPIVSKLDLPDSSKKLEAREPATKSAPPMKPLKLSKHERKAPNSHRPASQQSQKKSAQIQVQAEQKSIPVPLPPNDNKTLRDSGPSDLFSPQQSSNAFVSLTAKSGVSKPSEPALPPQQPGTTKSKVSSIKKLKKKPSKSRKSKKVAPKEVKMEDDNLLEEFIHENKVYLADRRRTQALQLVIGSVVAVAVLAYWVKS